MYKLHLIMPMGGAGLRFSRSIGFDVPKPLITIRDYPFLYWSTETVISQIPVNQISFIVLREHVENFNIDNVIHSFFPRANIAVLEKQLNGPVLTCREGLKQLRVDPDEALLINDCDHIFKSSDLTRHIIREHPVNGLVTFKSNEPQFSYIKYDNSNKVAGTVEKQVVSNDAICGAYLFKDLKTFIETANEYVTGGLGAYSEFFMSGMYNVLAQKEPLHIFHADYHVSFGTPEEYFAAQAPANNFMFSAIRCG